MPYNLLTEKWIPVLRADGKPDIIAPHQIAETDNPVIQLNASRPDFNGALVQFLIGLLQTAFAPEDDDAWLDHFLETPDTTLLQSAFARYQHAFNLDGNGARFMQDFDPLSEQKPLAMTVLLMDTMGSETHFVKDLPQQGFSFANAAIALYALQTNAPSGGAGHRTSMRGGGPLTTLVLSTPKDNNSPVPLWQTLWLNVLNRSAFASEKNTPEDIFPWLAPTRTSEKGSKTTITTPLDVNPLQMFWNMPRRIRLLTEDLAAGECGLSNQHSAQLIREYRTKNYGINYPGENWQHTLSPYADDGKQRLSIHARGAIQYRHWLGLMQRTEQKKTQRLPAQVVSHFLKQRIEPLEDEDAAQRFRVWAFGYDMDNMKPLCWYEATMPLFHFSNEKNRQAVEDSAERLIQAASEFVGNLRSCLKEAWFSDGDPRRKGADTSFIEAEFWQGTEATFYNLLERIAKQAQDEALRLHCFEQWRHHLHQDTVARFDHWANTAQISEQTHPRRIATARKKLQQFNWKKAIKKLLEIADKPKSL